VKEFDIISCRHLQIINYFGDVGEVISKITLNLKYLILDRWLFRNLKCDLVSFMASDKITYETLSIDSEKLK